MEKNGLINFLLLWIVSICSVACSCDMQVPHGDVTWWCARQDPPCPYSCHEGYKEHDTVSWLECSTTGQWVAWLSYLQVRSEDLCTPKPCPTVISKGAFSAACKAVVGSTCSFSCEVGYMRNTSVSELTCQTSTEWSSDLRSLCLRPDGEQCPYYIPRGDLNLTCIREPGQTCNFTCDDGYKPSISPSTIACGSNLNWNHNPESLCQEIICPKLFEGGYVDWICSRKYKATCSAFQCNPGYVIRVLVSYVKCDESGKWVDPYEKSSACVKKDQRCPHNFPGGNIIWYCNRIPQEVCMYECSPGYLKNSSITRLTCQDNRLWNVDTNSLCIQSDMFNTSSSTIFRTTSPAAKTPTTSLFPTLICDMQIPHGELTWWCAIQGPPCPYSCHEGYKQHDTVSWLNCSTSGQWVPLYPYQLDGVKFSIEDLCTRNFNGSRSSGERNGDGNVGTIVGITVGALTGILIIIFFVRWFAKRSSVRKSPRRVPGNVGGTCLRPRENRDQNVTTLRQQPNADGIGSVSSFESPSHNGLYVHSFVQRIPKISSSCNYPDPPPSYLETQIATNESPPTYDEAVTDPYILNLYI